MHLRKRKLLAWGALLLGLVSNTPAIWAQEPDVFRSAFLNPARQARTHCYWWWLNGNTDEATITRDLQQMKAKGYGGAILIDANGSNQFGNENVPAGPMFGSPEWRKLYRHAIAEAADLGLEISLTIQSGWNLGGPTVKPEQASKLLTFSRVVLNGPTHERLSLEQPETTNGFYRDIAVLAYPLHSGQSQAGRDGDSRQPIKLLREKAAFTEFGRSMPVTTPLLEDFPPRPHEEDTHVNEVLDLTSQLSGNQLSWSAPAGDWEVLRIGYTDSGALVSTSSGKWQGLAIDHMDHTAFESYWNGNVKPLIKDAQPHMGKSLRYLVTDSWELGGTNWTARFREEFKKRRGYDLLPYLPVVSGRIVESRDLSNRFLNDFRKTIGDLIRDEHYTVFARMAEQAGLGIHPESGGPHGAPIDALRTLGISTIPQTEFWAKSATHRSSDEDRFFMKEASSAAHTYGKTIVAGEGMTSIGPQWEEAIWNNLKPTFDQAVCSGLNLLFWHTFTSIPKQFGLPGREYFAGTHLNPNVTWWNYAGPFISYINRVQSVMQQGLPVADVLYYYGDRVPNFVQLQASDPAGVLPGYDYDVLDEDVLVSRSSVRNGRVVLPGGTSYAILAIGDRLNISLAAIRKIREMVSAGATIVGARPQRTTGLTGGMVDDSEVQKISAELWGNCGETAQEAHSFGLGHVFCVDSARQVLAKQHLHPDFEAKANRPGAVLNYFHRRGGETDVYFVRSENAEPVTAELTLRTNRKHPELWHPDTGVTEPHWLYEDCADGRMKIPVSLEPYGSVMVVLRPSPVGHIAELERDGTKLFPGLNMPEAALPALSRDAQGRWFIQSELAGHYGATSTDGSKLRAEVSSVPQRRLIEGEWTVHFPEGWNAPSVATFEHLISWPASSDPGVRYFSGTATYSKTIDIPTELLEQGDLYLDLGEVREIAQVTLNGKALPILWKKPFTVALRDSARPGSNKLEIAVTNLWPNRLIGDQNLPPQSRLTHTNITKFKADSPLLPSGLLGPVNLVSKRKPVAFAK